ncbi:glycosyltransferase family 2 protein [Leucobacter chromiireducens]|uniref:glycosyltransferase family 2 protein n=1 Tax=Leucobacter chromiireducens TaxID=283877 RepID=UPI000F62E023|nr:glycosyltransferase family 2 protein [Leucobacter chromiireducens]
MRGTKFQRGVGVVVVLIVVAAAAILIWGVSATEPPPLWAPAHATLAGVWTVLYNSQLPSTNVLLIAIAIALLVGAGIALAERFVTNRYRRSPATVQRRALTPRRVMAETRGVYHGPITVTVLIPAHNEEASLPAALASLAAQTRRPDRIIVVADNCTDRTVEVARRAGVEVFETVDNRHKKAGGLNQALRGLLPTLGPNDTVMVMDADTGLGERFLEVAEQRCAADRALMAVGGLFNGEEGHGLIGQFQRDEYTRYARQIRRRQGRPFVLTGTATVFRATALRAVAEARGSELPGIAGDVYDTIALTEDNELTIALKSLGALITSPSECTVTTELMPSWRMLWAQRLRWQRGALENLGAYGLTPVTFRYWAQQLGIGYSTIALTSYLALMIIMLLSMDTWVWFPFWLGVGALFVVERVVTVWEGGWRARLLALTVFPELAYSLFLNIVFLQGIIDISLGKSGAWKHLPSTEPASGGAA